MKHAHLYAAAFFAAFCLQVLAGDAPGLIRQGESQLKAGQTAEAIATLRQAIAADPRSSLAYTRLGGAQVLHQDYDSGIESFQQAITLDDQNADAFVGMGIAYLHMGRYALARAALQEAKRIEPAKQAEIDALIAWIDERAPPSRNRPN